MMKPEDLETGMVVANHGDRSNPAHYGRITDIRIGPVQTSIEISPIHIDRKPYRVGIGTIRQECNPTARIVTAEAHQGHCSKAPLEDLEEL